MVEQEDWKKRVFVAYCSQDRRLVNAISDSLKNVDLIPLIAEDIGSANIPLPIKASLGITESLHFVPIFTQLSMNEQWLNQETGFAYGLEHLYKLQFDNELQVPFPILRNTIKKIGPFLNPIEIYPIVETQIAKELKGWVNKDIEYIPLESSDFSFTIFNLLSQIRRRLESRYGIFLTIIIKCPNCGFQFRGQMPTQDELNTAVKAKDYMQWDCQQCLQPIKVNPFTFNVD